MRAASWIGIALLLSFCSPALAQEEWSNFKFPEDGFEVNFPGAPQLSTITWTTPYRYVLPGHVYTASHDGERYSVTVVDYNPVEAQALERVKHCPVGAETCIGN